jgi:hypothetical protein
LKPRWNTSVAEIVRPIASRKTNRFAEISCMIYFPGRVGDMRLGWSAMRWKILILRREKNYFSVATRFLHA